MISKRFIITIVTILVVGVVAGVAVFLAKGYTFSPGEKRIVGTGIINVSSQPDAASVYIDGHLTTATNATVSSLPPKGYTVRVIKEGFIPWEKKVEVEEGLVTEVKVTLFPAIPTIYPLTFTGVANPVLSPDNSKLAYVVINGKKKGVWVWTMVKNEPIAFARNSEPHQIVKGSEVDDYSKLSLRWSPDSKQVLVSIGNNNYLADSDRFNGEPRDITPVLQTTLRSWEEDVKARDDARILEIANLTVRKIASESAVLNWSPDETKFMFRKEPVAQAATGKESVINDVKVYDLETKLQYDLPPAKAHLWLPSSTHVILVEDESVSVVDFDGTNKAVIYAGKFSDSFVFPWPDSSRLVLITSFPTPTASEPNLYGINLK